MRKFVVAILLLFVFSSPSFSQVVIKKEHRVLNRDPGYCCWCCLETLGRHHKIESLYNLAENREKEFTWVWNSSKKSWEQSPYVLIDYGNYKKYELRNPASPQALANKLNELKIKYRCQDYYNYDKTLLKEAIKNKQGCLVIVKSWWVENPSVRNTHGILLLDYNEKGIEFYDPNDKEKTYIPDHKWFDYYWLGYVLVIDK